MDSSISSYNQEINLLLIGYCHLDDGFLYASKALEKLNYKIFFFPYLSHIMDNIENRDEILIEKIKNDNINVCLWWINNMNYESYKKIISEQNKEISGKTKVKNYFFNWDAFLYNYEKYNSYSWKDKIDNKKLYYPLMNHIFSCYETEIDYFKKEWNQPERENDSNKSISYAHSGFDKNISFYEYDEKYICDISIVCTNLYNNTSEFPDESTNITRYEIVNKLYENRNKINFHIYGPEHFRELYPDCYKGFIKYRDCNKVFSNSKINLSIHPMVNELNGLNSNEIYFSERVPQILGSKGLLLTNSYLSNKLINNEDYIFINNHMDWFQLVMDIISDIDKYNIVRENGYNKALLYYQWDKWAECLDNQVRKT